MNYNQRVAKAAKDKIIVDELKRRQEEKDTAPMSMDNLKCCGNCKNVDGDGEDRGMYCDKHSYSKGPYNYNQFCELWAWDEVRDRTFKR